MNDKGIGQVNQKDLELFAERIQRVELNANYVQMESLHPLRVIRCLELQCNGLMNISVPQGSFLCLEELDLSYNDFGSAMNLFTELQKLPKLKKLCLVQCGLRSLKTSERLDFPDLVHLNLAENSMDKSLFKALEGLPRLEELNLNENMIQCIPNLRTYQTDISDHRYHERHDGGLSQSLKILRLAKNRISNFEDLNPLFEFEKLELLELWDNPILLNIQQTNLLKSEMYEEVHLKLVHPKDEEKWQKRKRILSFAGGREGGTLAKMLLRDSKTMEQYANQLERKYQSRKIAEFNENEKATQPQDVLPDDESSSDSFFITQPQQSEPHNSGPKPSNVCDKTGPSSGTVVGKLRRQNSTLLAVASSDFGRNAQAALVRNKTDALVKARASSLRELAAKRPKSREKYYSYNSDWFKLASVISHIEQESLNNNDSNNNDDDDDNSSVRRATSPIFEDQLSDNSFDDPQLLRGTDRHSALNQLKLAVKSRLK